MKTALSLVAACGFIAGLLTLVICSMMGAAICAQYLTQGTTPSNYTIADGYAFLGWAIVGFVVALICKCIDNVLRFEEREIYERAERDALRRLGAPVESPIAVFPRGRRRFACHMRYTFAKC